MKAVRVHAFGLDNPMQVDDVPAPAPAPGMLLVRVRAAGVNPLEIIIRTGMHDRSKSMTLPYICGTDLAGEVEAAGDGAENFSPGDRVWGRTMGGSYAEDALVPAAQTGRLPDDISFAGGASFPIPLITAWNALVLQAKARPGETVLVQGGAGGVGHLAIQLARALGCRVLATASTRTKADLCREAGAEAVIFYKDEDVPGRVMELTGGRGADVVAEMVAAENLGDDLRLISTGGRIVIVGTGTGKGVETNLFIPAAMHRDARLFFISTTNLIPRIPGFLPRLEALLQSGAIRPHVGKEFPLEEADAAHRLVLSGKMLGKVVLSI